MKKELFNEWYEFVGKDFAKNILPIDDVNEKEMRKIAKNIFSSVYNLIIDELCDRLSYLNLDIFEHLSKLRNIEKCDKNLMLGYIEEKESLNKVLTSIYDSFIKGDIKKEDFELIKAELIPKYVDLKNNINVFSNFLKMCKEEKKALESLLVVDNEY